MYVRWVTTPSKLAPFSRATSMRETVRTFFATLTAPKAIANGLVNCMTQTTNSTQKMSTDNDDDVKINTQQKLNSM